ncbi:MAG: VWA domain-containing protein [Thermodesulfobacteriota bacterium]|nr:VWA domain-containing protein [Thermodesulfobacteriota bacterium]
MLNILIQFTACCRSYDLRVSTSEVLDCAEHFKMINPVDELEFKTVLKANFAKSRRDQSRFEFLYNLFFHDIKPLEKTINPFSDQIKNSDPLKKIADQLRKEISDDPMELALLDFIQGDPASYLNQIHGLHTMEEASQKVLKSNMGQLSNKLSVMLLINKIKNRVLALSGGIYDHLDQKSLKHVNDHFMNILNTAYTLVADEPREYNESLKEKKSRGNQNGEPGGKSFSSLTPGEVKELKKVIDRLVKKLKDQTTRRFAVKNRGIVDIKKTLRNSGKYLGVPMEIKYKNRPPRKSSIVTLCDVSGSVWSASKFMLNILYSLQECFTRVKSFVFVSEIAEITKVFEKYEIDQAIDKALNEADINFSDRTDYGATFQAFKKNHINCLNQKTTLIIMGDARSNYLNPQGNILSEMREKCRRIIWLNPEPCNTWNSGDSEMYTYKPHCHEVRTCMNLNHLVEFIEELVL